MSSNGNYNYKGPGNFVIENGIIKGIEVPYIPADKSCGEKILECLKAKPDFVGQICPETGREETFAEMMQKSIKCSIWLRKQNVKPGDVISVCSYNQMDLYVPCFGSLYTGAIINGWWNDGLDKMMGLHFAKLTRPKVVFVEVALASLVQEVLQEIGKDTKIVVFGKVPGFLSLDDIVAKVDSKSVSEFSCTKLANLDQPSVIMLTSGSTGFPREVQYSHRSLIRNIETFLKFRPSKHVSTLITFSPLAWITGLYIMLRAVCKSERRVICASFADEKTLELIEKYKVNEFFANTWIANKLPELLGKTTYDMSSLKKILVGGAPFSAAKQKTLMEMLPHTDICQAYGSTELGTAGIVQGDIRKLGSCGTVVENVIIKVVDPHTGETLGPNRPGEMCVKSPTMMTGYYKDPEATRQVIDSEGWLHTGDLARYDEEGHVFVVGRIKENFQRADGHYISPVIIEQVLLNHPEVIDAAVVGISCDEIDVHPIAFVVTAPNAKVLGEDLEELVADTLPDCMKLRGGVKFVETLPHTASGKVAKFELTKLAKSFAH